jgi:hypothetical protein
MADKKPTLKLWSIQLGELSDFEVRVENKEIVAEHPDTHETLKFPGGITKDELLELVDAHNEANDGVKAITEEELQAEKELDEANDKLLESL